MADIFRSIKMKSGASPCNTRIKPLEWGDVMQKANEERHSGMEDMLHDFLRTIPLFDTLDAEELSIVSKHIAIFEIERGDFLFKEGEVGDTVCFILKGSLDVVKRSDKNMIEIATLSKGWSVGEMSIVDASKRSATIKARQRSSLAALSREDFEAILESHPKSVRTQVSCMPFQTTAS